MSISIHVMIMHACRSIGSGHVHEHTCHDHACMPVMWQVFELRGVRDADLMLMSEADKEALLLQILSEQEAEHGETQQGAPVAPSILDRDSSGIQEDGDNEELRERGYISVCLTLQYLST